MRTSIGRRRGLGLTAALLLAACAAQPSPTPTASETPSQSAGAEEPSVEPTAGPSLPVHPNPSPSSTELIQAAVADKRISEATGYLYRFYAFWGDPRLPEEYRADWSEDAVAMDLAIDAYDGYGGDEQAMLKPFLVRPTQADSYWNRLREATARAPDTAILALAPSGGTCNTDGWAHLDMPDVPVTIWGQCDLVNGAFAFTSLVDRVALAAQTIDEVWAKMTNLMGTPIGDRFATGRQGAGEPAEAGDGRLDIYIVTATSTSQRDLTTGAAPGVAVQAPPYENLTSSTYLVIDPVKSGTATYFRFVVAHELFHALQAAHNRHGVIVCPYRSLGGCAADKKTFHWFEEASAQWGANWALRDIRPDSAYPWFRFFEATWQSMSDEANGNAYRSYMWAFFMEQESSRGADSIADAWRAMHGKQGWFPIQDAVDAQLPFKSHFRDFAVRVWNARLDPGDPISPRFQALDPGFPTTRPGEVPAPFRVPEVEVYLNPVFQPVYTAHSDLWELWSEYHEFSLDPGVGQVVLNFSGLRSSSDLDVDALVKIRDVGWQRRKLEPGENQWCFDNADDHVEQFIIVLSNHSKAPQHGVTGDWTITPKLEGCATVTGASLQYTSTDHNGNRGDPYYTTSQESLTLKVSLKAAPADSPYGAMYVDAGSTYSAHFKTHSELQSIGCVITGNSEGNKSGTMPEPDSILADLGQSYDRDPNGEPVLSISASFPVEVMSSVDYCSLGVETSTFVATVALPSCDGTEVEGSGPARVFSFNCHFAGDTLTWSVVGTVTLNP